MLAVAVGFVIYPLIESKDDIINSDWPAFATGAHLIVTDPGHLYDLDKQRQVEFQVTGGKVLVTLGIKGILPFLAPGWVALVAVPEFPRAIYLFLHPFLRGGIVAAT